MKKPRLGQHFLSSGKVISEISKTIQNLKELYQCDSVIEVGPGQGVLTKRLLNIFSTVIVIEKDRSLEKYLTSTDFEGIEIVWSDVLEVDIKNVLSRFNLDPKKTLIVGNLPYYITSPILTKFFSSGESFFPGGVFLIQKEVAEKITLLAHKKSYLWRLLNFFYTVKKVLSVPAKAFTPPPKVISAVITLHKKDLNGEDQKIYTQDFFKKMKIFLDFFSSSKRKTLGAVLKHFMKKNPGKQADFDLPERLFSQRLETLGYNDIFDSFK